MTEDKLIVLLSLELYDLKAKIRRIRDYAEEGYEDCKKEDSKVGLSSFIDIVDECDTGELYD